MTEPLADALAARTEALCAIPSPIGQEKPLCDALEAWSRERFPRVRRVLDSLVVMVDPEDGPPGRPLVALCGHLDTVQVHEEDRGPPRREDGRIVAPGSSDMKSGVAVAIELAERMPRSARAADLALVLYSREEGPFVENELGPVLEQASELRRAALAVCLEPTDGKLQLGCVGSLHATLAFEGKAAHSARPW
ncbi:MAG: M20/M25/M40 family metallo-hydrolase, partial [Anaeromyxobacteraceae bacterium]